VTIHYARCGTGITVRRVLTLGGSPADLRDTLRHASAGAAPEAQLAAIERDAQSTDEAALIIRHVRIVRRALITNDAARAARYALALGRLVTQAAMKAEWERDALAGARAREGAQQGGRLKRYVGLVEAIAIKREFDQRIARARAEHRCISATALQALMAKERARRSAGKPYSVNGVIKAIARANKHLSSVRGKVDSRPGIVS